MYIPGLYDFAVKLPDFYRIFIRTYISMTYILPRQRFAMTLSYYVTRLIHHKETKDNRNEGFLFFSICMGTFLKMFIYFKFNAIEDLSTVLSSRHCHDKYIRTCRSNDTVSNFLETLVSTDRMKSKIILYSTM